MKAVTYTRRASRTLKRLPANVMRRIVKKVEQYADSPEELASNVSQLRGVPAKRLRVGDWRVIFAETEAEVNVLDIGPRGSIYGP